MKRRKNLKQMGLEQDFTLKHCQSIVSSNQIEIMDGKGESSLELFPAKFPMTQRKRRRRRGRDMCVFPQDLVIEILVRLPTKSLMRFKCVSKQWSFLISSRYFCERLFRVTQEQPPRLYMCLVDDDGQRELLSISSNKTCFVVDQDLSIQGIGGFFLNGLCGLMCYTVRKKACIYNPTIKQLLTLPAIKSDIKAEEGEMKHHIRYYVGHDPVNDQYKLFCTNVISSGLLNKVKAEHWVLVLEAGGSWKKVGNYHPHVPFSLGRCITTGSVLHYMAWLDMETCAVVSFDFRSEGLTTIPISWEVGNVPPRIIRMRAELIEYGGKIAVFDHSSLREKGLVYLWVLKDKKKWSKKMSLVLQPCQRHLVNDIDLMVKGTTQDGKVILAPLEISSSPFYILCYDMQSNDLRKFEIKGVPHRWFDKKCYFDLKVVDDKTKNMVYLDF